MKTIFACFALVTTLLLGSCDQTQKVIDVAGNVQLSGSYTVNNIANTSAGATIPDDLTLRFAALDKSVRGFTGCNTLFGNYTTDLYALSFGEIAVTEKDCGPKLMAIERSFLDAINTVGSYKLEGNVLTLYSKIDRSVLITATKETKEEK